MKPTPILCLFTLTLAAVVLDLSCAGVLTSYRQEITTPTDHAKVVRQLVHEVDWAAVGTISTDQKTLGYPMVNMLSIADSAKDVASTGHIYFLLTNLDFTGKDLEQDNKMTLLFSSEQLGECSRKSIDPMSPICARAIISGQVNKMDTTSAEYQQALQAFISRHPAATLWLEVHEFYLCKLDIKNIFVLDWYGGAVEVTAENYYNSSA